MFCCDWARHSPTPLIRQRERQRWKKYCNVLNTHTYTHTTTHIQRHTHIHKYINIYFYNLSVAKVLGAYYFVNLKETLTFKCHEWKAPSLAETESSAVKVWMEVRADWQGPLEVCAWHASFPLFLWLFLEPRTLQPGASFYMLVENVAFLCNSATSKQTCVYVCLCVWIFLLQHDLKI